MKYLIPLLIVTGLLASCKSDTTKAVDTPISAAKQKLTDDPTIANANQYIAEIRKAIIANGTDQKDLILEGLSTAEQYKLGPQAVSFLMPLIKDYPQDAETGERMAKLASALSDLNRPEAASIVAKGYLATNPAGKYKASLINKLGSLEGSTTDQLQEMAKAVFVDPDKYGINRKNAQRYVDACEAFALAYPNDAEAPTYLYRGAEMARTLRTFTKALSIYDWIEEKYPDYEKTPTTVFLKGFMLENDLNNKEKAKEVYEGFLTKYPDHELIDDIKFLIENIDKSDKEIMEMIESKQKPS